MLSFLWKLRKATALGLHVLADFVEHRHRQ